MVGKKVSNGWKISSDFSNDWKKSFQWLENFGFSGECVDGAAAAEIAARHLANGACASHFFPPAATRSTPPAALSILPANTPRGHPTRRAAPPSRRGESACARSGIPAFPSQRSSPPRLPLNSLKNQVFQPFCLTQKGGRKHKSGIGRERNRMVPEFQVSYLRKRRYQSRIYCAGKQGCL